jgi:SAM-dependent methyltransferase
MRDPDGRVFLTADRVIRWVSPSRVESFETLLDSSFLKEDVSAGRIVPTHLIDTDEAISLVKGAEADDHELGNSGERFYEHEKVGFISYPYEWPAEMGHAAAALTLSLSQRALKAGYRLKDATPYNILFSGTKPVFVDLLSFEKREAGDPMWPAEGQYLRMFLLPLLAEKRYGLSFGQVLSLQRDGMVPDVLYRMSSWIGRLSPTFARYVSLPVWLAHYGDDPAVYSARKLKRDDQAVFVLERTLARLQRSTRRVSPRDAKGSHWSRYMTDKSYSDNEFTQKEAFVRGAIAKAQPKYVLDIGANTGHFSLMAAEAGARVVAIDSDAESVGSIWRISHERQLDVLPLVQNIAEPSPGTGWENGETLPFLQRIEGRFDLVLMLAVIHHLILTNGIPIEKVLELAAKITCRYAIIEYVGAEDPMRLRLSRGRDSINREITLDRFEAACAKHFQTVSSERIGSSERWMYFLESCE